MFFLKLEGFEHFTVPIEILLVIIAFLLSDNVEEAQPAEVQPAEVQPAEVQPEDSNAEESFESAEEGNIQSENSEAPSILGIAARRGSDTSPVNTYDLTLPGTIPPVRHGDDFLSLLSAIMRGLWLAQRSSNESRVIITEVRQGIEEVRNNQSNLLELTSESNWHFINFIPQTFNLPHWVPAQPFINYIPQAFTLPHWVPAQPFLFDPAIITNFMQAALQTIVYGGAAAAQIVINGGTGVFQIIATGGNGIINSLLTNILYTVSIQLLSLCLYLAKFTLIVSVIAYGSYLIIRNIPNSTFRLIPYLATLVYNFFCSFRAATPETTKNNSIVAGGGGGNGPFETFSIVNDVPQPEGANLYLNGIPKDKREDYSLLFFLLLLILLAILLKYEQYKRKKHELHKFIKTYRGKP